MDPLLIGITILLIILGWKIFKFSVKVILLIIIVSLVMTVGVPIIKDNVGIQTIAP